MTKPDSTHYLAHFTKDGNPVGDGRHYQGMRARDRLVSILKEKTIHSSTMPWTNTRAVCFTESPWSSLLDHSKNYSPYGIGFAKETVFNKGGNPVWYINSELYRSKRWSPDDKITGFLTPFSPRYASGERKLDNKIVDYSHEREWRTLDDFSFSYGEISFVILDNVEDLSHIPSDIVAEIGSEKFIFMDMYKRIETLWPTHLIR